ncbi:MAG: undecaprenyl-diphosphate phosphatase [Oscillibacter sp.]|nr:undecaprenyl-diphosphate phosphatase [Oscillibacter sp.]MBQ2995977.1 undecaprenyl-diphosphate phosphatase [Oscillibacter sp.]
MSLISAILLGLVQGITEFLPISSSGHLAIAEKLLNVSGGTEVPGFFDVLLHLGTLVAVFVAYWADIREMIVEFFCGVGDIAHHSTPCPLPPARRMILLVIVATLPLFVIVPFKDQIEALSGSIYFVAAALIVTGCMLYFSDRVPKGRKTEKTATMKDALIVGIGQAIATCPGISRSGTTITVGCFMGYERSFAVRFSFIMSIPAILGANILSLKDAFEAGIIWGDVPVYLVGVAVAALSGYACIRLLKMIAAKGKFGAFAYYCWAVGALTIIGTIVKG